MFFHTAIEKGTRMQKKMLFFRLIFNIKIIIDNFCKQLDCNLLSTSIFFCSLSPLFPLNIAINHEHRLFELYFFHTFKIYSANFYSSFFVQYCSFHNLNQHYFFHLFLFSFEINTTRKIRASEFLTTKTHTQKSYTRIYAYI